MEEKRTVLLRILTLITLAVWGASLTIPAVSLGKDFKYGLDILVTGWLGFSVGTYAWFANIGFIISIVLLLKNKSALALSFLSTVLAFTSYSWEIIVLDAGGAKSKVYGYGPGFYTWISAFFLTFMLNGLLFIKIKKKIIVGWLIIFVGASSLSVYFYLTFNEAQAQKALMNSEERAKFEQSHTIIKRTNVCSTHIADPEHIFQLTDSSVVEVVYPADFEHLKEKFFLELLSWGIPKVQYKNFVYQYLPSDSRVYQVYKTHKASDYTLSFENISKNHFTATLYKTEHPEIVGFKQSWSLDENGACPSFSDYPNKDLGPRKQVMSVFSDTENLKQPPRLSNSYENRTATIIPVDGDMYSTTLEDSPLNCPNTFQKLGYSPDNIFGVKLDYYVEKIGGDYFLTSFHNNPYGQQLCTSKHMYRSRIKSSPKALYLEKRDIQTFENIWKYQYQVKLDSMPGLPIKGRDYTIVEIKEGNKLIEALVTDGEHHYLITFEK